MLTDSGYKPKNSVVSIVSNDIQTAKMRYSIEFEQLWKNYPLKAGRDLAMRRFKASIKKQSDILDMALAMQQYLKYVEETGTIIKNGGTWFGEWRDWVDPRVVSQNIMARLSNKPDLMAKILKEKYGDDIPPDENAPGYQKAAWSQRNGGQWPWATWVNP